MCGLIGFLLFGYAAMSWLRYITSLDFMRSHDSLLDLVISISVLTILFILIAICIYAMLFGKCYYVDYDVAVYRNNQWFIVKKSEVKDGEYYQDVERK
jgi:hypothetical protein